MALDTGPEEFVGPFANWTTCTGLSGNGTTDDGPALQRCINNLSSTAPTMWLPAPSVCYNITAALTFSAKQFMRIIGASPSTTSICWGGSPQRTMLLSNGSGYSRIARITFNGESTAGIIINQNWDGSTGIFDTEDQYQDDVFENGRIGINCGGGGQGCAETVPIRSTFSHLTTAGISMGNANALDMFPWYSTFSNNAIGATNTAGSGAFTIYESYFNANTTADISIDNTNNFNFRWNYSTGSNRFFTGAQQPSPCPINFQGNVVVDTTVAESITSGCLGTIVAMDNTIRSLANATGPVIGTASAQNSNLFSIGNTFSANPPAVSATGSLISLSDIIVPRSALLSLAASTLPRTPPNNRRTITEVTAGTASATIQTDITNACTGGTTRPVVHLQAGGYSSVSLTIPANCDVQVIGDGLYTVLTGTGSGPAITCNGPNYATLRDFLIAGNGGVGLTCSGIDQPGGRVFAEGLTFQGTQSVQNVLFNGLVWTNFEAHNFFEQPSSPTPVGVNVVGPAGAWNGATVSIFAGVAYALTTPWTTSGNAHLIVRDVWYDTSGPSPQTSSFSGSGAVTIFGGNEAGPSPPAFNFTNFTGVGSVIGVFFQPAANTSLGVTFSSGVSKDVVLGSTSNAPTGGATFISNSVPTSQYAFLANQNNQNNVGTSAEVYLADVRNDTSPSFLINNLSQARAMPPTVPGNPLLPAGATDLRMYGLFFSGCSTCLSLNP